jgi:hypothetical protein
LLIEEGRLTFIDAYSSKIKVSCNNEAYEEIRKPLAK